RYLDVTGDHDLVEEIWPNIIAAMAWVESIGDHDGDGFIDYHKQSDTGLIQQGWKDSSDSVFHADGTDAEPPIALVEVQAYAYEAFIRAAEIATYFGDAE